MCRRLLARLTFAALVAGIVAGCGGGSAPEAASPKPEEAKTAPASERGPGLLRGRLTLIDGERVPLSRFRGDVVLVVNTASRCGYTPQFEGLEALYERSRADGFTVIGFPSDDFRQELAENGEIADFCRLGYGVAFPMAERTGVTGGPGTHPLYRAIAERPAPAGEPPSWNFTKYLLDREGRLVARFSSSVEPDDPALTAAVDALLAEAGGDGPASPS